LVGDSDSVPLKNWIRESNHHERRTNRTTQTPNNSDSIPREVLTTTARGVHTRASRDPSTADFAEAMMDWYLVGESDLMITSNPKVCIFGMTAALRTAMPVYNGETCLKM
jgi:hypothetical protein